CRRRNVAGIVEGSVLVRHRGGDHEWQHPECCLSQSKRDFGFLLADTAVKEAQKYRGKTITIVWEAGLQSLDPEKFSGPKWEELTGIKVKVIEVQTAEMFTKIMQEYRAGTGAYDALNVIPAWMPDLAQAG